MRRRLEIRTSTALRQILRACSCSLRHPLAVKRTPSFAADQRFGRWRPSYLRAASARVRINARADIRNVLPPEVEQRQDAPKALLGARFVELTSVDQSPSVGNQVAILDEVGDFRTRVGSCPESNRVLTTVLFTDIVRSTEWVARVGDRAWRDFLERHRALVRKEIGRFRGTEVDRAGDGFFAIFDGPARAVRCALSVREGMRYLGMDIRAGLHTGEIELTGENASGISVHIGARVLARATAGEVLVSSTVKDLVGGSGLCFTDRGTHALKGVPGKWRLFAVS